MDYAVNVWWLLVAHALGDYAWQSDVMGRQKDPWANPIRKLGPWWWHMGAHGLLNGGLVALVLQRVDLGMAEALVHAGLDLMKCYMIHWAREDEASVTLWTWIDQGGHLLSKCLWAWMAGWPS